MAIDTLAYVKELEAAGIDRNVAEAHVKALSDHALPDFATKADLGTLKSELTIRLGGMIVVATGILLAAKFFG